MAHYVVLGNFTDQGIRGVKETTKRAQALCDMALEMKISVKDIYWTIGSYDVVLTMEAPDDEAVSALLLKVGSLGNLRSQTLRAFTRKEMDSLLARL